MIIRTTTMLEILGQTFFQHALIAGVLMGVATGVMGTLIVIQRKVFVAGGIAHSAYGGVGLAYLLGFSPFLGALIFSVLSALSIGVLEKRNKQRTDTAIGILWATGMALGILFIDLSSGYAVDLMSFLFGSIIAIPTTDLYIAGLINIIILTTVILLFKEIKAHAFDPEFTEVQNTNNRIIPYIVLLLTALAVIIMIRLVGLILIIALLTIPASIAEKYTKNLIHMIVLATGIGIALILCGLAIAYVFNFTAGATIILLSAAVYGIVLLLQRFAKQ